MEFAVPYIVASVAIAVMNCAVAAYAFHKNRTTGLYLSLTCLGAAFVDISYMVSVLLKSYFAFSLASSIYFIGIDMMLNALILFVLAFARQKRNRLTHCLLMVSHTYMTFEMVIFLINPFREFVISYRYDGSFLAPYDYVMHPLYVGHLIYTYALVVLFGIILIDKAIHVTSRYRNQYIYPIISVLVVVGGNAIFLYLKGLTPLARLDFSTLGYGIVCMILYWSCFSYTQNGMLKYFRNDLFNVLDEGILFFDYDSRLIMWNKKMKDFLPTIKITEDMPLSQFVSLCEIRPDRLSSSEATSQCYLAMKDGMTRPVRVDYKHDIDRKGKTISYILTFRDMTLHLDLLTGFHTKDDFVERYLTEAGSLSYPVSCGICDINALTDINNDEGRQTGDHEIRALSRLLRKHFPDKSLFARGRDANLLVVCPGMPISDMRETLEKVAAEFPRPIAYAAMEADGQKKTAAQALNEAGQAMQIRKILDEDSNRSAILTSLIQALKESDTETEAHVKRTQELGEKLGRRLGLSDLERAELSLLCILHDIGKIGVPVEILNKPGAISREEWASLKSHVTKGYQIARSTPDLMVIAESILHHHERWDGTGYPDALSGEDIPLLSRMIAIVDSYDAMVNDRPYQKARSLDYAFLELERCAGHQFDPDLTAAMITMLKEERAAGLLTDHSDRTGTPVPDEPSPESLLLRESADKYIFPIFHSTYYLDENMHIITMDSHFEEITGYSREDVEALHMIQADLIPEAYREAYIALVNQEKAKDPLLYIHHKLLKKDGSEIDVLCFGREYFDPAVRASRSEILVADISTIR